MLEEELVKAGAVRYGIFKLRSGVESDTYVDIKSAITRPSILKEISELLSEKVSAPKIAAVELGGALLLPGVSLLGNLPCVVIRKESKAYGIEERLVGDVHSGERIEIIEDVVTTGSSVLEAANLLRGKGAAVTRAICVVDREMGGSALLKKNGIELVSLTTLSGLRRKR